MIRSLLLLLFGLTLHASSAVAQKNGVVKIGMCSDVHLPTMHDGPWRLSTFLDSMKMASPDFIIELGDFVTPAPQYASAFALWKAYPGEKHNVIGNHEMDAGYSMAQALAYRDMKSSYYSFQKNGFLFVVLDGNDKKFADQKGYREYMGAAQAEWLAAQLRKAEDPVVIFSHQGLGSTNGIENQQEIRSILENHNATSKRSKVIACFNGHTHGDVAEELNGIWYITINSMSYEWLGEEYACIRYSEEVDKQYKWIKYTAPYKEPLFAVVEISTEGYIRIAGKKSEWVGPSPWDLGFPEIHKPYTVPEIRTRSLRFDSLK